MLLDLIHAGLGWPIASALILFSALSSFITAAFGMGGGVLMLALLANLLPAAAVIPVHGLVQLGSNTGRAAIMWRHARRDLLPPFVIGGIAGVIMGGLMVVQLPRGWLLVVLGVFVLYTVLGQPPGFLRRSAWLVGWASSVLTMFVGGTGPIVAAFVRAQQMDRMGYVGTSAVLMTLQHLLKSLTFAGLGFAFAPWLPLIALMILFGFAGTVLGKRVLLRTDEVRFQRILTVILTLLALRLIWTGAVDLTG